MKIIFISPVYYPSPYGGALALKLLAEGIAERGHEVTVFAFDGDKVSEEKSVSGVKLVRYQRIKRLANIAPSPKLIPRVISVMRQWQNKTDLFHICTSPLVGAGIYKILGGRKPVVATLEAYGGFCPLSSALCPSDNCSFIQRLKCLFEGRKAGQKILAIPYAAIYPLLISLMKKADRYIAASQVVKRKYVAHGYDEEKIDVIPNFYEEQINPSGTEVAHKPHTFNILYVGRLNKEKSVNILIQAFFELAKGNPNVQLTIVGEGYLSEGKALRKLVSKLKIDKQVFFIGEVPHEDVWRYYKAADVFVHPAIWAEPFGLTILEAMQFQLPLIVSNAGAPPEIAGDAGLVFEKGNVNDLAQKLGLVYKDEKLRQKLSSNCSKVLQNYDRDKIIDGIETLYQEVVSGS